MLVRHGGKHDWYHNPTTKISQPVPRHTEINERLAQRILTKDVAQPLAILLFYSSEYGLGGLHCTH